MRFPISTMRSLRHFEIYFRPQQLRVITLISVGAKDSIGVFVSEVELMDEVRGGFGDVGSIQQERSGGFYNWQLYMIIGPIVVSSDC